MTDTTSGTHRELHERIAALESALRALTVACLDDFGSGYADGANHTDEESVYAGIPDGEGITYGMIRNACKLLGIEVQTNDE